MRSPSLLALAVVSSLLMASGRSLVACEDRRPHAIGTQVTTSQNSSGMFTCAVKYGPIFYWAYSGSGASCPETYTVPAHYVVNDCPGVQENDVCCANGPIVMHARKDHYYTGSPPGAPCTSSNQGQTSSCQEVITTYYPFDAGYKQQCDLHSVSPCDAGLGGIEYGLDISDPTEAEILEDLAH